LLALISQKTHQGYTWAWAKEGHFGAMAKSKESYQKG
jgi:hypothetical protein